MDVSVIIVNYNSYQYLIDCIDSIYRNVVDVEFEIIVVDNNTLTSDMSKTISCKYPEVNLILLDENLGFGGANNIGASYAKGEYLFFLNPDTILINNAILILSAFLKQHSDVALCGGNLYKRNLTPNRSYSLSFMSTLDILMYIFNIKTHKKDECFNETEIPKNVAWIIGADMMICKKIFDEIGKFDSEFFMYKEELDISMRTKQIQYKIYSVPAAKIIHIEGGCSGDEVFNRKTHYIYLDSEIRFIKKHFFCLYPLVFILYLLKSILGYMLYLLLNNKHKKNYWKKNFLVIINTIKSQTDILKICSKN